MAEHDKTWPPRASFAEKLARLIRTRPDDVGETIAERVLRETEDERAHQQRVREALEDRARPKRGRFRL